MKKIERKSISRNGAYNSYNNIAKHGKNIEKLKQTKNRKKVLKNIHCLKKYLMNNLTLRTCLI